MRCGCPECGVYMVHADGLELGCVCPACGVRCKDCLGTDTVLSPDQIRRQAEELRALFDQEKARRIEGRSACNPVDLEK